jgi:hypothetical protein
MTATPTTASVKNVMALAFELARIREQHGAQSDVYLSEVRALRAEVERLAAQSAPVQAVQADTSKPEGFTQGVDAAASMLDKMADDFSNQHAWIDPDTGVAELAGAKEEYYNTLRELADSVRSIVHDTKKGNSHGRS